MNTNKARIHKLVMPIYLNNMNNLLEARKKVLIMCNGRNLSDDEWVQADNELLALFKE